MSCDDPCRPRTKPGKTYNPRWCNPACEKPKLEVVTKVMIKPCGKEPIHPCDPPRPCDTSKPSEGGKCQPAICKHRIKNYPNPAYLRCKPFYKFPVKFCQALERHPCDPPLPCDPNKPPVFPCKVAICRHRIKNPPPKKVHRCPGPDDIVSKDICENMDLFFRTFIKKCPEPRCKNFPAVPTLPLADTYDPNDE